MSREFVLQEVFRISDCLSDIFATLQHGHIFQELCENKPSIRPFVFVIHISDDGQTIIFFKPNNQHEKNLNYLKIS